MTTMILFPSTHILLPRGISCPQNGNKWRSTKYLMDLFQGELNGIKTRKKKGKKISCMMLGPVEQQTIEASSTSLQWNKNYLGITNPITLQNSISWPNNNSNSGNKWMNKINHLTSFQLLSIKWDIFLSTIIWSNKDFKDVWTCICAQESKRKNWISTLNPWSLNCLIPQLLGPFPLL